jgi:uncharacterized protein YyaL (SSP411 family)
MSGFWRRSLVFSVLVVLTACTHQPANPPASGVRVETINGVVQYTNHLISEKSPYLQLHAHNPVDWYPWGREAFDKARREDKAIFLSIGYAACHWCHVMETESFSDPAIAELMNRDFVSIKVDREERPDVDRVYLAYVNSVGSGGWPMSLFLTLDLQPFFGATYLPPDTRDGQEGLRQTLTRVAGTWRTRRAAVLKVAAEGNATINSLAEIPQPVAMASSIRALDETFEGLARSFDRVNGGFGSSPKFPRPVVLTFLLRYHARRQAQPALDMTVATLRAMAHGAIRDQLGGGFHRYTVDAGWRLPHFEKMLYDQAQLAVAYTEAFQVTRDPELEAVARDTLDYVLRHLREASGGFYAAEDADSRVSGSDDRLAEGAFYLWTIGEFARILGRDAALVGDYFDVSAAGNLGPDADPGLSGENALAVRHTVDETAARFKLSRPAVQRAIDGSRRRLLADRETRPRPARDEKVVTAWNGLMISALARAGEVFGDRRYIDAGLAAARFVESHLLDQSSASLKRHYRNGTADVDALLEDYAFLIQGLLDLYEASFEPRWLVVASRLQATQDRLFWDEKDGAYFSTAANVGHLLARMKEDYDGAEPAANSVSAMNLLRLWQLLEDDRWRTRADATFHALSGRVARSGTAVPLLMAALDFRQSTPKQIVIAGDPAASDTQALLRVVHDRFLPNKVLARVDGGAGQAEMTKLVPQLAEMTRRDGRATIYVCENYACQLPTSDPVVAARLLDRR